MLKEYSVSKTEVIRRQWAFFSLSLFLVIGLFFGSKLFDVPVPIWFYLIYIFILIVSNIWIRLFFKKFLEMKICLSKDLLERKTNKKSEKFHLVEIKEIKIKKTSKNTIREIYIYLANGKNIFINGLDNFEKFANDLIKFSKDKVTVKYLHEFLDFDSLFFYPILGLILSITTTYFLKIMMNLSYHVARVVIICLLVYIVLVGAYFIFSKPISKRY